jgi:hypothetical protein
MYSILHIFKGAVLNKSFVHVVKKIVFKWVGVV